MFRGSATSTRSARTVCTSEFDADILMAITVQELNIYPLKSARGIPKARVRLAATGFEWDRHWLVIREDGMFLTQRTHPLLTHILTDLTDDGLLLSAEGREPVRLPFAPQGAARPVRIWKDDCQGLDQGDEAAAWVSGVLGERVRIEIGRASWWERV